MKEVLAILIVLSRDDVAVDLPFTDCKYLSVGWDRSRRVAICGGRLMAECGFPLFGFVQHSIQAVVGPDFLHDLSKMPMKRRFWAEPCKERRVLGT